MYLVYHTEWQQSISTTMVFKKCTHERCILLCGQRGGWADICGTVTTVYCKIDVAKRLAFHFDCNGVRMKMKGNANESLKLKC